jgi:hypothetical protein
VRKGAKNHFHSCCLANFHGQLKDLGKKIDDRFLDSSCPYNTFHTFQLANFQESMIELGRKKVLFKIKQFVIKIRKYVN